MNKEIIKQAIELRHIGVYSMRDIARKLNVDRVELIKKINEQELG